ncbi:MAG: sulfite exporter TauE/SafE family protein [Bdellovibrionota bacterium]|nr:sulfite exporter TauE/SafE family protein [Bdellovibrionota bacterium]
MEEQMLSASLALAFGAAHAIEPGHGKTALFTYLASGKCTWREGVTIALSSSITHSVVVLAIAFVSHYLFSHVDDVNTHIVNGLRYISAAIICGIGVFLFFKKGESSCSHCDHHGHDHHHEHHHHAPQEEQKVEKKSLLASGLLGFATGLIPCPSVIVAYLAGISHGNSYLGLKAVFFFAVGMALSLVALVFVFSIGGKKFEKLLEKKSFSLNWNKIQGSVFVLIGLVTAFYH